MIDLTSMLEGHSKAMFSTFLYYRPQRILLDCGEGAAMQMGTKVFGIEKILLSHGHIDHISGIPMVLFTRMAAKGDNTKPLLIFYPENDPDILRLKAYCDDQFSDLPYQLFWIGIKPGHALHLGKEKSCVAYETKHDSTRTTLGYKFYEKRKKLKPEFKSLHSPNIVEALATMPLEDVMDVQDRIILNYTGDTVPLDVKEFENTDVVLHECTFLDGNDVKYKSHSVLEDVMKIMMQAQPKALFLYHISTRYSAAHAQKLVKEMCKEMEVVFPVWIMYGENMWQV